MKFGLRIAFFALLVIVSIAGCIYVFVTHKASIYVPAIIAVIGTALMLAKEIVQLKNSK